MAEFPHILAKNHLEDATVSLAEDEGGAPLAEDSVYRLVHLADGSRLSKWYENDYAEGIRATFAFSSAVEADTWVLDKNFVIPGASATVELQYSDDGIDWTGNVADTIPATLDSSTIYWRTFTARTKPYWRIRLTSLTGPVSVFNLWLGKGSS